MIRALILASMVAVTACAAAQSVEVSDLDADFAKSSLVIEADRYQCFHFVVYVADTFPLQRRGLMYVRALPRMTGMLFVYERPGLRSMWMKNTYIPLDMLFIRGDGTVESIASETVPLSLVPIRSGEPVVYVLELNAGVSRELMIGTDSRVYFPANAAGL